MTEFPFVTPEQDLTLEMLVEMYNEATAYIYKRKAQMKALDKQLDLYPQAYDELTMKLYG